MHKIIADFGLHITDIRLKYYENISKYYELSDTNQSLQCRDPSAFEAVFVRHEKYFRKFLREKTVTETEMRGCYDVYNSLEAGAVSAGGNETTEYQKTANHSKGWDAKPRGLKRKSRQPGRLYFDP